MDQSHLNTLIVPVYWETLEPEEGSYDNQVFERKEDGSLVTVYEEIAIPFSEFDPANLPSYTIKYTTTYLA